VKNEQLKSVFLEQQLADGLLEDVGDLLLTLFRGQEGFCARGDEQILQPPLQGQRIVRDRPPVLDQRGLGSIVMDVFSWHRPFLA
jgi:hypothetical protein